MNTLLSKLPYWLEVLREGLFPQGCALCSTPLFQDSFYGLCHNCRENLEIPAAMRGRCSLCGQPLISEQITCLTCRNCPERFFDRLMSLYPYMGKYKKTLGEYKFKRRLCVGNFIAEKLLQGLELLLQAENITDFCLVPVPPRAGKIKHSGWDQIDYLAKILPKQKLSIINKFTIKRYLKRLPSASQKELNKENRLQNLKGKIIVNSHYLYDKKQNRIPKTVILFDDVYTTGATMDACAAALKSAGAERVFGICLCYD